MNSGHDEQTNAEHYEPHFLYLFQWRSFFLFCISLGIIILYTVSTSDMFNIPKETKQSYVEFKMAMQRYDANPLYWDLKQRNLVDEIKVDITKTGGKNAPLILQDASPEMLISFLTKELKFPYERLSSIAVTPKPSHSSLQLLVSKLDQGVWPFEIILTLEIEFSLVHGKPQLLFTRLRRGKEDLATGLTWAYFGSDLEWLRRLGVASMKASQGNVF